MKEKEETKKVRKTTKKKEDTKVVKETKGPKAKKVKKEEKKLKETKKKKTEAVAIKKEETKKEVKKAIKKEPKTENDKVLLDDKSQNRLKALSKVVSIIAKIGKICLMIIVPFIFIAMIAIPFVLHNLEVNGNVIKFSDASIVINDDYVTFKAGDKIYVSNEDVKALTSVANFFANNTKGDIILLTEVSLGFVSAILIISIYSLIYMEKLFNNIHTQSTPFSVENTDYIYRIGHLMIISAIVSLVFEITIGVLFPKLYIVNITSYGIIEILMVFVIYYIFKYATKLQEEKKTSIYNRLI